MPKPKRTKTVQIRLTPDEKQCLNRIVQREGEGASYVLRLALREYTAKHHPDLLEKR